MTRITNADQVLLLLRSYLQRTQRAERRPVAAPLREGAQKTPLERVQSLARRETSDAEISRALVRGVLLHEFGSGVANDASFQATVDEVLATIRRDEALSRLLDDAVRQLMDQ